MVSIKISVAFPNQALTKFPDLSRIRRFNLYGRYSYVSCDYDFSVCSRPLSHSTHIPVNFTWPSVQNMKKTLLACNSSFSIVQKTLMMIHCIHCGDDPCVREVYGTCPMSINRLLKASLAMLMHSASIYIRSMQGLFMVMLRGGEGGHTSTHQATYP